MLSVLSRRSTHQKLCNGVSRRNALQIGSLGLAGLSLPQLLRAEQKSGNGKRHKSVIMIYLCGGPPHQDMYDIKVNAPKEIRGELNPIDTSVPGIQVGELLPGVARNMDKLVRIRSMVGARDSHYSYQCMTGYHDRLPRPKRSGRWLASFRFGRQSLRGPDSAWHSTLCQPVLQDQTSTLQRAQPWIPRTRPFGIRPERSRTRQPGTSRNHIGTAQPTTPAARFFRSVSSRRRRIRKNVGNGCFHGTGHGDFDIS